MTKGRFRIWIFLFLIVFFLILFAQKRAAIVFKGVAIKEINKLINTNAELDNVDLNLLKGLAAFSGLRVRNPAGFNQENFLEIKRGYIDIDLFSLLSKKRILIQKIFLEKPNIAIEINKGSVSNASLIFKKSASGRGGPADGDPNIPPLPSGERVEPALTLNEVKGKGVRGNKPWLAIDKINIKDGIFKLTNYKVNREGAAALFDRINISIEDLRSAQHPNELPTTVKCFARLPAKDLIGDVEFALKGAFLTSQIDFDLDLKANNISLPFFMPFYANNAVIVVKKGWFNLDSIARCRKGQLRATETVHVRDIELVSNVANLEENLVFGLPVVTVLNFFVNSRESLDFDFEITGTIADPKFHIKEALEKVLAKSIGDAILSRLSKISDKLLEKVSQTGKLEEAGKEALKDVLQKILQLKEEQK